MKSNKNNLILRFDHYWMKIILVLESVSISFQAKYVTEKCMKILHSLPV